MIIRHLQNVSYMTTAFILGWRMQRLPERVESRVIERVQHMQGPDYSKVRVTVVGARDCNVQTPPTS